MLLYITIHINGRDALDISNTEYMYLSGIMSLERNRHGGYCGEGDAYMSEVIGIARKNIIEMKKRLITRGLLELSKSGLPRVTDKFRDVCNAAQKSVSDHFNDGASGTKGGKKPGRQKSNVSLQPDPAKDVTKRYSASNETLQTSNETLHPVHDVLIDTEYTFLQYSTAEKKSDEKNDFDKPEGENVTSLVSLFRESIYFKGGAGREKFEADLKAAGCPGEVDFDYYFNRILTWSDKNGAKSKDWGKTALKVVQDDAKQGHMATVQFMPIDQQPQQAQPQHATHSRRNGSSRKNAIDPAQVLADVERIIADGW